MRESNALNTVPRTAALAVVATLRAAGHSAFFAGGCVRDTLLGLVPKDYDVATDALPDRVRTLFHNTQAIGAAFGVILVRQNGVAIEVATFRTDGVYTDGRRPDKVSFSTAEDDAQRRDFTINGLFLDPTDGRIIDYVGGQADLAAKTLRAIGVPARRFKEDHLRLLRAVRFAARLGFVIEKSTAAAMIAHADQLEQISPQRVGDELRRICTSGSRTLGWSLITTLGLNRPIFRGLRVTGDRSSSIDLVSRLPISETPSFATILAAAAMAFIARDASGVMASLAGPSARVTAQRLRANLELSNDERDEFVSIFEQIHTLLTTPATRPAYMRHLAGHHAASVSALLSALGSAPEYVALHDKIRAVRQNLDALRTADFAAAPLLTGDDLTAAGLIPGPAFKKILRAVYDAQLEGTITDRAAALTLASRLAKDDR